MIKTIKQIEKKYNVKLENPMEGVYTDNYLFVVDKNEFRDIPLILCLLYYNKYFSFINSMFKFHNKHLI